MARQHLTCATCTCAKAQDPERDGVEVPDHSGLCAAAHREWWRLWNAQSTGDLHALSNAARAAEAASRRCPVCKAGGPAPRKGGA